MAQGAALVEIDGLKALTRDLAHSIDPHAGEVLDYMKRAGVQAATPVADAARAAVPHDSDTLSGDIRVSASRTGATIRMGRPGKVAYAGWIEFGGTRRRPHQSQRPYMGGGRYLWPAARALQSSVGSIYSAAIENAFASFSWTNQGSNAEGVHD